MNNFEINANLNEGDIGVPDFNNFMGTVMLVRNKFNEYFGVETMGCIPLLIDNGTQHTGHTPIITPVWNTGLIIKLHIANGSDAAKIIFQLAHELTHYVFFSRLGLGKSRADVVEESYCTAASLIMMKELLPGAFNMYAGHVSQITNEGYRRGLDVAVEINFNMETLKQKIYKRTTELENRK